MNQFRLFLFYLLMILSVSFGKTITKIDEINNDDFYKLKKIVVNETGIYILDAGNVEVFHYSSPHQLKSRFMRAGQGPGESIEPQGLIADRDTIYVLGHTLRRIIKFVNAQEDKQLKLNHNLPAAFTKLTNKFIVNFVMDDIFLSVYDINGKELSSICPIGAAKEKLKDSPTNLFSCISHLSSDDHFLYITYLYKNRIEKYDLNFNLIESKEINEKLQEPYVTQNRAGQFQNYFINGNEISKNLQHYKGKLYLLWQNQPATADCKNLNILSIYDTNLQHFQDFYFNECVSDFYIYNELIYCVSNEPVPKVLIYELPK